MDFSETFEPKIKSWQEENEDKRSVILITLEEAGEGKRAAGVSIMGNGFNIAYSIAEALNGSGDLRTLFSAGVKLASMMKLEKIKKATKEK